jgi:Cu-Zn family superoxide dismutase
MKRNIYLITSTAILAFGLAACSTIGSHKADALATLNPTKDSTVTGTISFTKVDDGVRIDGDVKGLTPGPHGFHIHEKGDCSAPDAASAGGHYNPTDMPHGDPAAALRHIGDLGNIEADASGVAKFTRVDRIIKLDGPTAIIGHAVIVHAKADDLKSQPAGNAGGRVACGIIGAKK